MKSYWIVIAVTSSIPSTYGHVLAIVLSRDELFSMADIVTPNLKEASKLLGDVSLHTISDMRNAAESIYKFGPKYVFSVSVYVFYLPHLFSYPTCADVCYHILVHPMLHLHGRNVTTSAWPPSVLFESFKYIIRSKLVAIKLGITGNLHLHHNLRCNFYLFHLVNGIWCLVILVLYVIAIDISYWYR